MNGGLRVDFSWVPSDGKFHRCEMLIDPSGQSQLWIDGKPTDETDFFRQLGFTGDYETE